ncbi:uncharacterized protein ACLA_059290 [Aspergillus clavatus NRRL 1]|uniref:Uncharacterized protein n=1 Tax=Aspergillus clavatus (strain ATCC 1007 / CBS 513.65 / DSM 816 / NCTC 3887 / NRRL 1 / QM 1276 / 107) TaxID=344612 RepID=A1C4C5_ASPCL|nr:uncharacterized protein ACLA_059290 [Aspergillus clavatus NRRL 1]EAW15265.1 hypothetical protein ACLA_059290 [Aspergillus clavatus NRRL 1]
MAVVSVLSPEKSHLTTASLLMDLLEVFQTTLPSAATTRHSTSASVGVEKDNYFQLSCDSRGGTPPNSPLYSVYAKKPRATASDCNVLGSPKSAVTLNDDDVATLQGLGPANGGQLTPNTVDTAATGGQRLAPGARVSNLEERKTCGV